MGPEQRIRAELERQLAEHGTAPGQDHAPALYARVLVAVAETCQASQSDVLAVHRQMWAERREAA